MNFKAFAVISFAVANGMLLGCKTAETASGSKKSLAGTVTAAGKNQTIPEWVPKPAPYRATETQLTDLVHTKLRVSFDWQKQHLIGEATLTCRPYFYPQNTLVLDAKGFDIKSVELEETASPLKYTYDGRKLTINLDKTYNRTQEYQVLIHYVAKPNELKAGGSAAITSDKGLYFINPLGEDKEKPRQIWTQGETEASSCWFPTIDAPNQKMTQEIYITIEDNFKTLSNGSLIYSRQRPNGMRTDYWKQELPHAPYLAMMAIGEFAVVKESWKNKDVTYYVEPKYKNSAKGIFGNTPEMLSFFSQKLGVDYPWEKYAQVIVRDYVSGAMENTSASLFGEFVQLSNRELLDHSMDEIIAHELFHQWFGNLVTTESWSNLPLNESFATYGEYLWFEHKLGRDEADMGLQNDLGSYLREARQKQVPLIRYHYHNHEDMFDRHSYQKGGRVLHMLRNHVGDEAFFASLKKYLADNKFKAAEIHHLRLAFEEVTGQDLNWFFDQWFLQPGHPEIQIDQKFENGKLTVRVFQNQDTAFTPLFKLPVKIAIWSNGKKTEYPVTVSKFRNVFEFPASAKPELIVFDPDAQLLGTIQHEKTQEELIYQYYHAERFQHKFQALNLLMDKVSEPNVTAVFKDALNAKFWKLRSTAVFAFNATRFMTSADGKDASGNVKFSSPEFTAIKTQLRKIAETDPKTSVRAEALATLASYRDPQFTDVFGKALQDSSYAVAAAGLDALASQDKAKEMLPKIKPLQETRNAEVTHALASFYASHGDVAQLPWYEKQIKQQTGTNLSNFLPVFAAYLLRLPTPEKNKGTRTLEEMARTNGNYRIRLGAYRALQILADDPAVQQMIRKIKETEKDERLKALYGEI
ncbi:M1 family metallopeptidase [Adhaeribacter sp. BT258]|uniref:Aminopeptidase N n=1 Tax=Adhaeribacter terrigena TaxID=2793070 RepID=A0ABS1BWB9_9BACT|nr:M1 family metallopeptidase [Adhaeribacter terrigena]MBK0401386.1 M1 family metallopeptidase [Adhaeribacter terrigena]